MVILQWANIVTAVFVVVSMGCLLFILIHRGKEIRALKAENVVLKARIGEYEVQVGPEFRRKMKDKSRQTTFGNQIFNALNGSLSDLILPYNGEIKDEYGTSYFIQIADALTHELVMTIEVSSRIGLRLRMLYMSQTAQYGYGDLSQSNVTSIIKNVQDSAAEYREYYAKSSSPHGT